MTEEFKPLNEAAFKFPKIRVVPVSTKDAKLLGPSSRDAEETSAAHPGPSEEGDTASMPSISSIGR